MVITVRNMLNVINCIVSNLVVFRGPPFVLDIMPIHVCADIFCDQQPRRPDIWSTRWLRAPVISKETSIRAPAYIP